MLNNELLDARKGKLSLAQKKALLDKLKGKSTTTKSAPVITRLGRTHAPLSAAQQRLWFEWLLNPENTAYHLGGGLVLKGKLDTTILAQSLQHLVQRHQALRSQFIEAENGLPIQQVLPDMLMPLEQVTLDELAQTAAKYKDLNQAQLQQTLLADFAQAGFDLRTGPLLRVQLISFNEQEHLLLVVMHHMISDAWSKNLIIKDFVGFYQSLIKGDTPQHNMHALQYIDFAQWQIDWLQSEAKEVQQQWTFWQQELSGQLPVINVSETHINIDKPASGVILLDNLPTTLAEQTKQFARSQGMTIFTVLLTAYQALLYRTTGLEDLLTAIPVANRNHYDTHDVVGFFVNMQLLRVNVSGADTLAHLLQRCSDKTLAVQANQDIPIDALMKRFQTDLQSTGYQVMFNHLKANNEALNQLSGLALTEYLTLTQGVMCDLALDTTELTNGAIKLQWAYDESRLTHAQVARFNKHYQTVLLQLVTNIDTPIRAIPLLKNSEQQQLLHWGQGEHSPQPTLLPLSFTQQALKTPTAKALKIAGQHLTYQQLNEQVNRLSHYLLEQGVGLESRVGILLERSVDMVIAMLAVLKSGAAYVPFDPAYPKQRLDFMWQHSDCTLLFSHQIFADHISASGQDKTVYLDNFDTHLYSNDEPLVNIQPDNLAYIIYTSGSTGQPKGVACNHLGVANRLAWGQSHYQISASDRILQKTSFGFDVSIWEFFWPLTQGAELVLAEPEQHKDPLQIQALIQQEQITVVHFVPSMLQAFLLSSDVETCTSLRQVFTSGEALPKEAQNQLLAALPQVALRNLYGPTETAIEVTYWHCQPNTDTQVPIGSPIAGVQAYIVDGDLNLVAPGRSGELLLGGRCLARGYLKRADLTSDRFIANPFINLSTNSGERLYRTGDLTSWTEEGHINYLGRVDQQVKIHGFRIELGEIEAQLLAQFSVKDAVVLAKSTVGGNKLVAYLVGNNIDEHALKQALSDILPEYMIPSLILILPAMPLTTNGKLDRKALPEPQWQSTVNYVAPEGEIEPQLAIIWQQLLCVDNVGREDNFFLLGGHSLLAVKGLNQIQAQWVVDLSVRDLFQKPILKELAQLISERSSANSEESLLDLEAFMETLV